MQVSAFGFGFDQDAQSLHLIPIPGSDEAQWESQL